MGTTQDNLPAVSDEPTTLEAVGRTAKSTLTDVRVVMGLVAFFAVTLPGGGWLALAQVRTEAKDAASEQTAGLSTEQAALKANVKDLREEVADVKAEVRELRKDLRLLFPKLPPTDAGR
jgi:cell division protein FtsB